jgi:hypothetical protein
VIDWIFFYFGFPYLPKNRHPTHIYEYCQLLPAAAAAAAAVVAIRSFL